MSADEVQRSFAGASPKGYAKPFGRQKRFDDRFVAIFGGISLFPLRC